jgi:DNA-binding response OmpR family regulator
MNPKKILLAEHDTFLIGVYAKELRASGFSVSIVPEEKIVLERIESVNPDLLILDVCLPEGDGISTLKNIRKNEKLKDLKVIMLSCFSDPDDIEKSIELGATKFFAKAENTAEELVNEIKKILD